MTSSARRAQIAAPSGAIRADSTSAGQRLASLVLTREALAWTMLLAAALPLRLAALPVRAFHHDEGQHGYFSWLFATDRGYHYTPVLHGPLRDLVTGGMFFLFGDSNWTARLAPALLGTAIVGLPFLLRRWLGSTAALAAALLFCVSPSYLYFSRFEREDIFVAALTLGLIVAVFRFLGRPQPWHPSVILGLLAASFATKETTYITVFVSGLFFLTATIVDLRDVRSGRVALRETRVIGPVISVGGSAWVWGVAAFLAVFILLFTSFFTNPAGLQAGLVDSIRYWLAQQPVGRGSQPPYYYFILLPAYELPAVVLGLVGAVTAVRRPSLLRLYLVWAVLSDLAVYTWAGEKMPWLVLHPLLPLILLAGIGAETLWSARRRFVAQAGLAATALAMIPMAWGAISVNYRHPADPTELLVFTQTSPDVPTVAARLVALDRRVVARTGQPLRLQVDQHYSMDWPWWWYLRHSRGAAPATMDDLAYVPPAGTQALLIADDNRRRLLPRLGKYTGFRFHHRAWWVPDYGGASLSDVARWLIFREHWNPRGGLDEWLYVRRGLH